MRILIILFFFFNTNFIISQEKKIYAAYEMTNSITGKPIYIKAKLFVDENLSLYTIDPKDVKYVKDESAIYLKKENRIKKIIYEPNENHFFLITNKDSIEHTSSSGGSNFLIKEKIYPYKWTTQPETKKIGKFICNKATTYFRGRNYIAWYSPEIPINSGPWKFSGLPGLILEVYDFKKIFTWKLKSIEYPFREKINFKILKKESYINLNLRKYVEIRDLKSKNFSSLIKSKLPKGSKIRDMQTKRTGIELTYEWEDVKED